MKQHAIASGSTPPAVQGETQAAQWVQKMFARIAPRYDLLNHLLSCNIDRGWRSILVEKLYPVLNDAQARVLDLCCGTGDVLLEFEKLGNARILGADFCHPMLVAAQQKIRIAEFHNPLFEADALNLPLADGSLDAIAISFGFRNLANYRAGLTELRRVLKTGGQLAILEFSHPPNAFIRIPYQLYSRYLLPLIGALVSGSREAYTYLPESIRNFPGAQQLRDMMNEAGFVTVEYTLLSGGIAALHVGRKR